MFVNKETSELIKISTSSFPHFNTKTKLGEKCYVKGPGATMNAKRRLCKLVIGFYSPYFDRQPVKGRDIINRFIREEVQSGAYEHTQAPPSVGPEFIIVLHLRMRFKETADFNSSSTSLPLRRFIALLGTWFINIGEFFINIYRQYLWHLSCATFNIIIDITQV